MPDAMTAEQIVRTYLGGSFSAYNPALEAAVIIDNRLAKLEADNARLLAALEAIAAISESDPVTGRPDYPFMLGAAQAHARAAIEEAKR